MRPLPWLTVLVVLLPVGLPAQARGQAEVVAGKVVDARTQQPLPHALVTLQSLHSEQTAASVYTDDNGRYRFQERLAPGKYRLEGQARGHLAAAYLEHGQLSTALVLGAGLPIGNLVLALNPQASISGRVLDESGDPVPHAVVSLFRESTDPGTSKYRQVGSRPVGDDGTYEFGPLVPGRYFLAARGTPWYAVHPPQDAGGGPQMYRVAIDPALDVAYPTVYYPEARTADGASPLDLAGGEEAVANMRLEPEHAVMLVIRRVPGASNGIPPQLTEKVFGAEMAVPVQTNTNEGFTTISGLAPGQYSVREYAGNGGRLPTDEGVVDLTGGSVTREAPTPGQRTSVTITLRPLATGALPKDALVTLSPQPAGSNYSPSASSVVNAKGEAEFADVPAGEYRVRVGGNRQNDLPVSALLVGGKRVSPAHLSVGGGRHLDLTAQLAGSAVTVEGFTKQGGRAAPACMVVLVPAGGLDDATLFRRDQSDLDGSFSLPDVAPGRYLLVGLENAWSLPWTDLHALEPYLLGAVPLEVPAGGGAVVKLASPLPVQQVR